MVYSCLSGAALRLGLKRVSDPSCDRRVRRTLVRAKLTIWWQVAQGGGVWEEEERRRRKVQRPTDSWASKAEEEGSRSVNVSNSCRRSL